jgi:C-terminal processing protease CtpA/Prc
VYADRPLSSQFYIALTPGIRNPSFDHELTYAHVAFPDPGLQLLALYRFWNIIQYWSPNRQVADENWPQLLRKFIPRFALAKDKDAYQLAMIALVAKVHDTHTNLWSSLQLQPPTGQCRLPVEVRFVESKPTVASYASTKNGPVSALKPGDILEQIDGRPVDDLIKEWRPFYGDSNEAAFQRDIAHSFTKGTCGPVHIVIRRSGKTFALESTRVPVADMDSIATHDLPGPTFRLLSENIAYMKLSSIKTADVAKDVEQARDTKGLIVDIRNYPSEFVVFALGSLLVDQAMPFARFTNPDITNPGAFLWGPTISIPRAQPHYSGKVIILVDEISQSQAEYTAMVLRSVPNAIVIGSTTAGADGNFSPRSASRRPQHWDQRSRRVLSR